MKIENGLPALKRVFGQHFEQQIICNSKIPLFVFYLKETAKINIPLTDFVFHLHLKLLWRFYFYNFEALSIDLLCLTKEWILVFIRKILKGNYQET